MTADPVILAILLVAVFVMAGTPKKGRISEPGERLPWSGAYQMT